MEQQQQQKRAELPARSTIEENVFIFAEIEASEQGEQMFVFTNAKYLREVH